MRMAGRVALVHLVNWYDERSLHEDVFAPIGSSYLAAALEAAGVQADLEVYRYDPDGFALPAIRANDLPLFIGISATGNEVDALKRLSLAIRAAYPGIPIVAGGYCSLDREGLFEDSALDIVALGEGEQTVVDLATVLSAGGSPRTVAGILFRDADSRIVQTAARPQPPSLDDLPMPVYDHIPNDSGIVRVYASRGCPYECTYCEIKDFYQRSRRIRSHGPRYIRRLIQALSARGDRPVEVVYFNDDEFLLAADHLRDVGTVARDLGVEIVFQTRTRDVVRHRETIAEHRDVIREIHMGVESFSQSQLDRWRKRVSVETNRAAMLVLSELAVPVYPYLILTDEKTTVRELAETCDGLLSLPPGPVRRVVHGRTALAWLTPVERDVRVQRMKTFHGDVERRPESEWLEALWTFVNLTVSSAAALSQIVGHARGSSQPGRPLPAPAAAEAADVGDLLRERIAYLPELAAEIVDMPIEQALERAESAASRFVRDSKIRRATYLAARLAADRERLVRF